MNTIQHNKVDGKGLTREVPVVGAVLQHGPLQLELRVGGGLRGHGLGLASPQLGVGEVLVLGYGGQAQRGLRGYSSYTDFTAE